MLITCNSKIIYFNDIPNSPFNCCPIKIAYIKETPDLIKSINDLNSSQVFQVCNLGQKKASKIHPKNVYSVDMNKLNHIMSVLYCWIRALEFILHLSYRLEFKTW